MPDLSFVPKKYHDFMTPSVRKLYLDIPSTSALVAEIERLKKRVTTLSRDRDVLMDKCEAYMGASRQLAEREKNARLEARAAQDATCVMQRKYDVLKKEYETNLDQYVFLPDAFYHIANLHQVLVTEVFRCPETQKQDIFACRAPFHCRRVRDVTRT